MTYTAHSPTERCPGGYLIRGARLCGPSGNRCVDVCAFEYLRRTLAAADTQPPQDQQSAGDKSREAP